jgi:DNA-binding MarR family transcriptional regulator
MSQYALRQDTLDAVDAIVEQWHRERPDLDPSAKHLTGRIIRLAGHFHAAFGERFAPLGITDGDFGILASLRRAGDPFELTPTELTRTQMMTSGGMTAAVDRLERKDLVARKPNPADRRGNLVGLTEGGRRVVDQAMELHAATEQTLVAGLDEDERATMERLLRRLVLSVEGGQR